MSDEFQSVALPFAVCTYVYIIFLPLFTLEWIIYWSCRKLRGIENFWKEVNKPVYMCIKLDQSWLSNESHNCNWLALVISWIVKELCRSLAICDNINYIFSRLEFIISDFLKIVCFNQGCNIAKKLTRWEQTWPRKDYMKYRLLEKLYGKHTEHNN